MLHGISVSVCLHASSEVRQVLLDQSWQTEWRTPDTFKPTELICPVGCPLFSLHDGQTVHIRARRKLAVLSAGWTGCQPDFIQPVGRYTSKAPRPAVCNQNNPPISHELCEPAWYAVNVCNVVSQYLLCSVSVSYKCYVAMIRLFTQTELRHLTFNSCENVFDVSPAH